VLRENDSSIRSSPCSCENYDFDSRPLIQFLEKLCQPGEHIPHEDIESFHSVESDNGNSITAYSKLYLIFSILFYHGIDKFLSLSASPVQILLIRHLNFQLSDGLLFMDYIENPESTHKEIPQKSKSLKICSLPPQISSPNRLTQTHIHKTNCLNLNIEVEVCETGPLELPDLFTKSSCLPTTFTETEILFSSAKRDAKHRLLE
jgi:hypothetical protein